MIDKTDVKAFQAIMHETIEKAVKELGTEATLKPGSRASYDATTGEVSIKWTFILGNEEEGLKADFERWAELYKLQKGDWGKTFKNGGRTFTVRGIRSRRCKRPIICKRDDGKEFVFESFLVRIFLHAPKGAAFVTFKDEDEDGRGTTMGPVRVLDKKEKEIANFGWLYKEEALRLARHVRATFREV